MSIQALTPYFILGGRAQQAVKFYQEALGATLHTLQRFGDVDQSCPEANRELVMHAELRAGSAVFMLSDGAADGGPPGGGNVSVAIQMTDVTRAREIFAALSVSGRVIQPLFDAPWGSLFGVVQDQFGVGWMFDCAKK